MKDKINYMMLLYFHIREAVQVAGAHRIGHGVSILYEDRPWELMREMANRGVLVEINLTSNQIILDVAGEDHPFPTYRAMGVPVTLSTDDEGVSRIDLTHEYLRATRTYDLTYQDLKELARNSLAHAFLPGDNLLQDLSRILPVDECAGDVPGSLTPSDPCRVFLERSEKARLQWWLEADFAGFEEDWLGMIDSLGLGAISQHHLPGLGEHRVKR